MKLNRFSLVAATIAAASLVLTACGGSSANDTAGDGGSTNAANGSKTLSGSLSGAGSTAQQAAMAAWQAAFQGANPDVTVARATDVTPDSSVITAKKRSREDWLVLLGFNHLMAGLEAYVSAHLWDFPGDLKIRATPGSVGASAVIPIRFR